MSTATALEAIDKEVWALTQRRAKALSDSDLIPKEYRGNLANVMVAMDMAERIGAAPLMVMQNLVIIHGRPSWSATFLIATINQCGRFSPLRYETTGDDPHAKTFRCRAIAIDRESQQPCEGEWIDWKMVDGEGWSKKAGSKWLTMPGQMFRYRAASFWARAFAPEVSMGIYTEDEVREMRDVTPAPTATGASPAEMVRPLNLPTPAHDAETGEVADEAPAASSSDWSGPSPEEQAEILRAEAAEAGLV